MVCGDPAKNSATYFSGFPASQVSPISCPDNVAFDSVGNLWISTDGAPSSIGYADGLFKVTLDGAERGKVEQFLAVPRDAETCGPVIHDDERTVFVAVQHPGEEGTFAEQHSVLPGLRRGRRDAEARPGARPASVRGPGVPHRRLASSRRSLTFGRFPSDAPSRSHVLADVPHFLFFAAGREGASGFWAAGREGASGFCGVRERRAELIIWDCE